MITKNPLLISSKGGTITCLKGDSGKKFITHALEIIASTQETYIQQNYP